MPDPLIVGSFIDDFMGSANAEAARVKLLDTASDPIISVTPPTVNQTSFDPATATVASVLDMMAQLLIILKEKNILP